jgi:pyrroline-5-carboxylate reductase
MIISDQFSNDDNAESNALGAARLAFVGAGMMAEAMIAGLLRQNLVRPAQVIASHPRAARREYLEQKYAIRTFEQNRAAAVFDEQKPAEIVVLSVKPQRLSGILRELSGALVSTQLVVSIIAGATLERIAGALHHAAVVRSMPNTPSQIGQGMTVWTATREVSEAQALQARALFSALGREMRVDEEKQIDMATALSATGPTYVFLLMEALIDAGVHLGFSRHVAEELVTQTILGSVLFARESKKHPAELRNMVTSPGGTSAEAIYQMEKGSLRTVLSKAVYAAYQRAAALGAEKPSGRQESADGK